MFVVAVNFEIHPEHFAAFRAAMIENARASLRDEPGCRQFDVCEADAGEGKIFLYELYDTRDDFSAHLLMPHFLAFDKLTAPWIASKTVSILSRIFPQEKH
jgi:quinol monooxygenase YgiN